VSIPAYCCAIQGRARHAQPLFLTHGASVEHTGSPDAAHISVTLVGENVTNVLAVDSTVVQWIAMMAPARSVQFGGVTNVSVERQWRRNCASKGFSSARGSVVGC